jgi:hypothetical protein
VLLTLGLPVYRALADVCLTLQANKSLPSPTTYLAR